jgi:5'-3' exonuclease
MKQVVKPNIKAEIKPDTSYTLIVDGNSLLKSSLVDKRTGLNGKEYGGIFQFMLCIRNIINKRSFSKLVVCWDGYNSGILRYQIYPLYKANRDKKYEFNNPQSDYERDIQDFCRRTLSYYKGKSNRKDKQRNETEEEIFERQRDILIKMLEELFARQYMFDSVEGDDIIAYNVINKKENEKVIIVTNDRDITQLISDDVCVYLTGLKKYITPQNHTQEIGYCYENVCLKKILVGDQSDNIYGVAGMGEETLFKLFPKIKSEKTTLNEVLELSKGMVDERVSNKKKPLKVTENILNRVTNGCQGYDLFEINEKIIDLHKPILTDEAREELDEVMDAPLESSGRDFKNLYKIVQINGMSEFFEENKFGTFFSAFNQLIENEKRYEEKCKKENV